MSRDTEDITLAHLNARLASCAGRPFVAGICGAQGSGKSWLVAGLAERLRAEELRVCVISLDDLYLTRAQRAELARTVHPLFAVRGVPGTHDVALGIELIEALGKQGEVAIPAFDKAQDDRVAPAEWPRTATPVDIILFEGWCVGAIPQPEGALAVPVNGLEASEDPDGSWRAAVNAALGGPYRDLFARLDTLILLKAPSFDVVARWRGEQEATLRAELTNACRSTAGLMDAPAIHRFISHYERLTRHILEEMPNRADLVIELDESREVKRATAASRS